MALTSKKTFPELVKDKLDAAKMEYTTKVKNGVTYFTVKANFTDKPEDTVHMDVDEDGACNYTCYPAFSVPDSKRTDILIVLNGLNKRFRFISLFLDNEGDICATYNLNTYKVNDDTASQAVSKLKVFIRIVNHCIPEIEQALSATKSTPVIIRTSPFSKS